MKKKRTTKKKRTAKDTREEVLLDKMTDHGQALEQEVARLIAKRAAACILDCKECSPMVVYGTLMSTLLSSRLGELRELIAIETNRCLFEAGICRADTF